MRMTDNDFYDAIRQFLYSVLWPLSGFDSLQKSSFEWQFLEIVVFLYHR
jgi:hypothetical protein